MHTKVDLISAQKSQYIVARFNLTVPSNATILGVIVSWYRKATSTNVVDDYIYLVKGNNVFTPAKYYNSWTTSYTWVAYGSPNDTWGVALDPLTLNNASFGAAMSAYSISGNAQANVSGAVIDVYYSGKTRSAMDANSFCKVKPIPLDLPLDN
jgi:hypothetical protein